MKQECIVAYIQYIYIYKAVDGQRAITADDSHHQTPMTSSKAIERKADEPEPDKPEKRQARCGDKTDGGVNTTNKREGQ